MNEKRATREKKKLIYFENGVVVDEYKWTKMLLSKNILEFEPKELDGSNLTYEYLQENHFDIPILVADSQGLDMDIPQVNVPQVAQLVGLDRMVDVLEVSTQTDRQMSLREWSAYFTLPIEKRDRILNVISLEIGESELGQLVQRPKIVRELDWIDNVWPRDIRVHEYPRVQLYCLMGVQDSYTDFHIDFGGTSVFYHVISGEKIFYFIEPTKQNLEIYGKWSMSPNQAENFLGDLTPCKKVHLKAGNTMFIPSGWIHAVFTPVDTVVIGGNFLHCFAIESQLKIAQLEKDTNVPMRFRFPYFANMQWYAAKKYLYTLKDISITLSDIELTSLQALVDYLSSLATSSTNFQRLTKAERKTIRSEIPPGLKNVTLLLQNLQFALACRRNGKRMEEGDDGWESDLTEMEFVDSDDELEDYLPEDVPLLSEEEPQSSDELNLESDDDDDDTDSNNSKKKKAKLVKKKKSKSKVSKKILKKIMKKPLKLNIMPVAPPPKITLSLKSGVVSAKTPIPAPLKAADLAAPSIDQNSKSTLVPPHAPVTQPKVAEGLPPKPNLPIPKPAKGAVKKEPAKPKKPTSVFDRLKKSMKKR